MSIFFDKNNYFFNNFIKLFQDVFFPFFFRGVSKRKGKKIKQKRLFYNIIKGFMILNSVLSRHHISVKFGHFCLSNIDKKNLDIIKKEIPSF